jgi:uncharacterized damage-inducible protein DinB
MKEYFKKLYQYNVWANKKVINCLKAQQVDDDKILTLMSHTLSALFIWLARIKGMPTSPFPLWQKYKLSELETMAEDIGKNWLEFIESTASFNRELSYTNYVGDPYVNNVENIMIHLVNHSTYHRAQIAILLRQKGFDPVNTDFITYDRVVTGQLQDR